MLNRLKPVFILLLLVIPSILFFFKPGIYWNMHDDMQLIRQMEMEKCLQDGQIPCRWTPDLGFGYGYPLFNFYPPMPYFVGQTFRVLGFSYISTVKLTAATQFIISALGMYLLASTLYGPIGGLISSLLFTYAPYHAVNVYIRGAMNEAWASTFFPFIFYFAYQAIVTQKLKFYLLLSLSYSFLLLSHNPMALIFSPFLALWLLYWLIVQHQIFHIKSILSLAASLISSVFLSAFFTLPVLFESKLVQIESMFQNYYHYSVHFVSFYQLFISNFWGDGPSLWGTADGMSFSIGYIHWILAIIVLMYTLYSYAKTKQINWLAIGLFLASFFSLFLTHERSTPIWQTISLIQKIQFPWRFLNISTFLFSLLAGTVLFNTNSKAHFKVIYLTAIIVLTYIIYLPFFSPVTSGPINDDQKFSGKAWVNQVTGGIYDYLPKTAQIAPQKPANDYVDEVSPASTLYELTGQKKGTDWLFFNINIKTPTTITLPILYFPNFKVFVDNKQIETKYEPVLGRITVSLNSGIHQIYLKLYDTPIRTISNQITIFSLLVFVYLFSTTLWKPKKSN